MIDAHDESLVILAIGLAVYGDVGVSAGASASKLFPSRHIMLTSVYVPGDQLRKNVLERRKFVCVKSGLFGDVFPEVE